LKNNLKKSLANILRILLFTNFTKNFKTKKMILEFIIALITLTFLEVVLGVDNIIFVSIVTNKLPETLQAKARFIGLMLALVFRIILLITIAWMIHHLTAPFFPIPGLSQEEVLEKLRLETGFLESAKLIFHTIGIRELILSLGGLFLLGKTVSEIHHKMGDDKHETTSTKAVTMRNIIMQIVILDIVFSFDSILTAVGMTQNVYAMVSAVVIAMLIMLKFSKSISHFIQTHPTTELLALSFLMLIGFMLVLEGVHIEVPKAYIYFAVFFSFVVELLNIKMSKKEKAKLEMESATKKPKLIKKSKK